MLLKEYPNESVQLSQTELVLTGEDGVNNRGRLNISINPQSNLPVNIAFRTSSLHLGATALNATLTSVDDSNLNLSSSEKELLCWHYCLGHLGFQRIQYLMKIGVLAGTKGTRHFAIYTPIVLSYNTILSVLHVSLGNKSEDQHLGNIRSRMKRELEHCPRDI